MMDQDFIIELQNGKKTLVKYTGNKSHVTIPDGIEKIGLEAFLECYSLESIVVSESVKIIDDDAFFHCHNLNSVVLSEGLEEIGNEAFGNCTSLKNIQIPDSVTRIDRSFYGCTNLTSVDIGEGVEEIWSAVFACCTSLSNVHLPKSLKTINGCVFSECTNLTTVVIPAEVEFIGDESFPAWTRFKLEVFYHHPSNFPDTEIWRINHIILLDQDENQIAELSVFNPSEGSPDNPFLERILAGRVNHLSEYDALFSSSNDIIIRKLQTALDRLECPHELNDEFQLIYTTYLRNHAEVIIPSLIQTGEIQLISRLASIGAIPKEYINIYIDQANELSYIEIFAFLMDYKNKTWGFDPQVSFDRFENNIEEWATLENCDGTLTIRKYQGNKKEVTIPASLKGRQVSRIEGNLGSLKVSIFFPDKDHVRKVEIEEGVLVIGERAFLECSNLESVIIPTSMTEIGKEAFAGCIKLHKILIPEDVTSIANDAFECCENLIVHTSQGAYVVDVWETRENIDGTLTIYKYLCKQKNVTIPAILKGKKVSRIEGEIWSNWTVNLRSVILEEGITEIGEMAFNNCNHLERVHIPSSVTRICDQAFERCRQLQSILIPESVKFISKSAFTGCDNLVIFATKGSYASEFAKEQGFTYEVA